MSNLKPHHKPQIALPKQDRIYRNNLPNFVADGKSWVRQVIVNGLTKEVVPVVHLLDPLSPNEPVVSVQGVRPGDLIFRNRFDAENGTVIYSVLALAVSKKPENVNDLEIVPHPSLISSMYQEPALTPELIEFLSPTTAQGHATGVLPDGFGWVNGVTLTMSRRRISYISMLTGYGLSKDHLDFITDTLIHSPSNQVKVKWRESIDLPLPPVTVKVEEPNVRNYWFLTYEDATGRTFYNDVTTGEDTIPLDDPTVIRAHNCVIKYDPSGAIRPEVISWELYGVDFG